MEIAPILLAVGSTLFASVNTYLIRRQSHKLKLLKGKYQVSLDETKKCIKEKDKMVEYVYKLYNIATELHQSLRSISSLHHTRPEAPVHQSLHCATVHIDPHADPSTNAFYTKWNKHTHPIHTLQFRCSTDDETNACVYLLAQLLACIEERKHKKNAIHAFHAGGMHTVIEAFSHFLHNTSASHLHIPIIAQKNVASLMQSLNTTSKPLTNTTFRQATHQWFNLLSSATTNRTPLLASATITNSHNAIATLMPPTDQKNLLSHYLLSDMTRDSLSQHTAPSPPQPNTNRPQDRIDTDTDTSETEDATTAVSVGAGVHCLTRAGTTTEFLVTDTDIAKRLHALHDELSAFNLLFDRFHATIAQLQRTRDEFQNTRSQHTPLLVYIWWKRVRKRHRIQSSRVALPLLGYIKEHFGSEGTKGMRRNAKQNKMYPLLKQRIKCNSTALHQSKRLLYMRNNTNNTNNTNSARSINHMIEELSNLYKKDIFDCAMHTRYPEWLLCVDMLGRVVECASSVIEQDMAFRCALIEPR